MGEFFHCFCFWDSYSYRCLHVSFQMSKHLQACFVGLDGVFSGVDVRVVV